MEDILKLFEKALADHHASIGRKDDLFVAGKMVLQEFRKLREDTITLGQLLADHAREQPERRPVLAPARPEAETDRAKCWNNI